MRLQRFLAQAGVASRRSAGDLVSAGLVTVNGKVVTEPWVEVEAGTDRVTVRGVDVAPEFATGTARTVALNKPAGVLTSRRDPRGRPTVYDLVTDPAGGRLAYVGRLDAETEGLLLLTTDGELAHRLAHPSYEVERTYVADVSGELDEAALSKGGKRGIDLGDGRTAPFSAKVRSRTGSGRNARRRIELVLVEGRNREVRRIVRAFGGTVDRLVRTRFGPVHLGSLVPGGWRRVEGEELARLRATVDLTGPAGPAKSGGKPRGKRGAERT